MGSNFSVEEEEEKKEEEEEEEKIRMRRRRRHTTRFRSASSLFCVSFRISKSALTQTNCDVPGLAATRGDQGGVRVALGDVAGEESPVLEQSERQRDDASSIEFDVVKGAASCSSDDDDDLDAGEKLEARPRRHSRFRLRLRLGFFLFSFSSSFYRNQTPRHHPARARKQRRRLLQARRLAPLEGGGRPRRARRPDRLGPQRRGPAEAGVLERRPDSQAHGRLVLVEDRRGAGAPGRGSQKVELFFDFF